MTLQWVGVLGSGIDRPSLLGEYAVGAELEEDDDEDEHQYQ